MSRPPSEAEIAARALDLPTLLTWSRREHYRDEEDEIDWVPIRELQSRCTSEVLDLGVRMCRDPDPRERDLGTTLLAAVGWGKEAPFYERATGALLRFIEAETQADLLYGGVVALHQHWPWHRSDFSSLPILIRLASHGDEQVRYGVAQALCGCDKPEAISALITLSIDLDEDVRDWATFGLGSLTDLDTEEIRAALWARIHEEDPEIRAEALVGLARRFVPGASEAVLKELEGDYLNAGTFEAASVLRDPRFIPHLEHWSESWGPEGRHFLDDALQACREQAALESGLASLAA